MMKATWAFGAAAFAAALAGCNPTDGLPSASLDRGGVSFDLQKLSDERFKVKDGGLTAECARRSAAESPRQLALRLETKTFWKDRHGLAFRYRCRITKPGTDPKVTFVIGGSVKDGTGAFVKSQGDWATKIRETGNAWAVYYVPDTGIRSTTDYCELRVDFNESLGSFEMKDIQSLPWEKKPAAQDPKKFDLEARILGLDSFKTDFHLARGLAMGIGYDWRVLDPKRKYANDKWEIELKVPAGVTFVSPCGAVKNSIAITAAPDGSSVVRYRQEAGWAPNPSGWKGWRNPAVYIKSDLPVGTRPGKIVFTPYYDGHAAAAPVETDLVLVEPFTARAVPKRYYNGINFFGPRTELTVPGTLGEFVKTILAAGIRAESCTWRLAEEYHRQEPGFKAFCSAYFISNGFFINSHPLEVEKRLANERFVCDDPTYKPDLIGKLTCPVAIYEEGPYFKNVVLPGLKREYQNMRSAGFRANWEPNPFFGHGCMCDRCRAAFAAYMKIPEAEIAKDWPGSVTPTGRYSQVVMKFRAKEHAKLVRTLQKHMLKTFGPESEGFVTDIVWTALTGQTWECPRYGEIAAEEYAGDLKTVCPWGPYAWWDTSVPYFREKRLPIASWEAARTIRAYVDGLYGERAPKLQACPHGRQATNWSDWEGQPEWTEMALDAYFFNRWQGSIVNFVPMGYDARWFQALADATTRAGLYEDYVWDGKRVDGLVTAEPVPEYAAPCTMVTAYLPKSRDVSPLCTAAYDLNGARIVAALNFWEEGEAFFTLKCRGLEKGRAYTVLSDRRTFWTKADGGCDWTAEELERGIFVQVGAARTKVFEIRPYAKPLSTDGCDRIGQGDVRRAYEAARPALEKAAACDREEEAGRTHLIPDGTPVI